MREQLATRADVQQADEQALYAMDAYLRPKLDWRGVAGGALLVAAGVLIWRKP